RFGHGVRDADLAEVAVQRLLDAHATPEAADELGGLKTIGIGERLEGLREQHLKAQPHGVREPADGDQTGRSHMRPLSSLGQCNSWIRNDWRYGGKKCEDRAHDTTCSHPSP